MKRYAYAWITAAFFFITIALHWYFGWMAFADDALQHGEAPRASAYLMEMGRDTFENWQSEFLQLLWQVVGLAYFLYVGSPASKENDDRMEAKIDAVLRFVGREDAVRVIKVIDHHYMRTHGHAQPHAHDEEAVEEMLAELTNKIREDPRR